MDGNNRKKARRTKDEECERSDLSEEEHRAFVSAIFNVGVQESSPLAIMDHMNKRSKKEYEGLNLEKVKSKLQKYRKNKSKYKAEFLDAYDTACSEFSNLNDSNIRGKAPYRHLPSVSSLSSGEVAAFLSHSTMQEGKQDSRTHTDTTVKPDFRYEKVGHERGLNLPIITQDEMKTPVGRAIGVFTTLFLTLKEELYRKRLEEKGSTPDIKLCDRSEDKPRCFRSRYDPSNNSSQTFEATKSEGLGNTKSYLGNPIQQNRIHDNQNGPSDHPQGYTIPHVDSYLTIQPLGITQNAVDIHTSAELLSHLGGLFPGNSTTLPPLQVSQQQRNPHNQQHIQQGALSRAASHGFNVSE